MLNKELNPISLSHIISENALTIPDTAFFMSLRYEDVMRMLLPLLESSKSKLLVPITVVHELDRLSKSANISKKFRAIDALVDLGKLLDNNQVIVVGKSTTDDHFTDKEIIAVMIRFITDNPVIVLSEDNGLLNSLRNTYYTIGSAIEHKKGLHLINSHLMLLDSIYESKSDPNSTFPVKRSAMTDISGGLYDNHGNIYQPLTFLASGMSGKVFKTKDGSKVMKVFHPSTGDDRDFYESIERLKIITSMALDVPSAICPEAFLYDSKGCLAGYTMRFIDAPTLADILCDGCYSICDYQLNFPKMYRICANFLTGIEKLRQAGVYVYDIRPENIMVNTSTLETYIIDAEGWFPVGSNAKPPQIQRWDPNFLTEEQGLAFRSVFLCLTAILFGKNPFAKIGTNNEHELKAAINKGDFPYTLDANFVDSWSEEIFDTNVPLTLKKMFISLFTHSSNAIYNLNDWVKAFENAISEVK